MPLTSSWVPYKAGMRLGMGYNTITGEHCMFDAVAPAPTLFPASPELAAPLPADMSALPTEYVFKRVHSVGEVMDAMALTTAQRASAILEGGLGFVTDELFLSSDICYFVQVRAMGEEAPMADMIQFNAYDGVPADDLARLYGDSFVSSFVIGGALTAVIAVKTGTKHSATRPTEAIETGFRTLEELAQQFGAGVRIWTQWEGARCTVQETICSGWTLDDLKKTIAGFHSARPVRIGAVLSKYTQLPSYWAWAKGQPRPGLATDTILAEDAIRSLLADYQAYSRFRRALLVADAELAGKNDILVLPSDRQDGYTGDLAGIASARLDCQAALDSIRSFVKIIQASPADVADRDMKYTSPAIFRSRMPHFEPRDLPTTDEPEGQPNSQSARLPEANAPTSKATGAYSGYCPVPLDVPLAFFNLHTKKSLDHCGEGYTVHMWDRHCGHQQAWIVSRASDGGFYIKSVPRQGQRSRYLCLARQLDKEHVLLSLTTDEQQAMSVFFEAQAAAPKGKRECFVIRVQERHLGSYDWSVAPLHALSNNSQPLCVWNGKWKTTADQWRIFSSDCKVLPGYE